MILCTYRTQGIRSNWWQRLRLVQRSVQLALTERSTSTVISTGVPFQLHFLVSIANESQETQESLMGSFWMIYNVNVFLGKRWSPLDMSVKGLCKIDYLYSHGVIGSDHNALTLK